MGDRRAPAEEGMIMLGEFVSGEGYTRYSGGRWRKKKSRFGVPEKTKDIYLQIINVSCIIMDEGWIKANQKSVRLLAGSSGSRREWRTSCEEGGVMRHGGKRYNSTVRYKVEIKKTAVDSAATGGGAGGGLCAMDASVQCSSVVLADEEVATLGSGRGDANARQMNGV